MSTQLAEMLSTRLCHDLTGPIGAVRNGAEFLEDEESGMQGEALQLVASSAQEAVSRMQFYRRAYGRVNVGGEADLQQCRTLVEGFLDASPIALDWAIESMDVGHVSLSQRMSRILLNLLVIGCGALLRGGRVSVSLSGCEVDGEAVSVSACGETVRLDESVREALEGEVVDAELTPKNVQAVFLQRIAGEIGMRVSCAVEAEVLTLTVHKVVEGEI